MAQFKIRKLTALPGMLEANAIYIIAPAAKPDYIEMYVTGTVSTNIKRIIGEDDIALMISDAMAAARELKIVADITALNLLTPSQPEYVFVIDATGDLTVASGGATYLYNPGTMSWIKVSEAESLDVAATWASLSGKPTSTPENIDDAVGKAHVHNNKTQLDKIDEDVNGEFLYNGAAPHIAWDSAEW